jgi:hypothetical protein
VTDPEIPPAEPRTPPGPAARHVEIKDEGDRTVAEAEVTTARGPEGTVRTSMHAQSGRVRPGQRASLVDAVMDLPEVRASERVEAAVPYGDGESLDRLRERTQDAETRAAGATTLLDATIPPAPGPASEQPADGQQPGDE